MADLIIRNVDENTVAFVRQQAAEHALPIDAEVKKIFFKGLNSSLATERLLEELRRLRDAGPRMPEGWDIDQIINGGHVMIVADANLISYLCIAGKDTELAEQVLRADPDRICPVLWRSELLSVFTKYIRASLLTIEHALSLWEKAENTVKKSRVSNPMTVLHVISEGSLSSYDSEYVALAKGLSIPLVTFDKKVMAAFPDVAKSPERFVAA